MRTFQQIDADIKVIDDILKDQHPVVPMSEDVERVLRKIRFNLVLEKSCLEGAVEGVFDTLGNNEGGKVE